jgi:inorganic pyrophosphatase
MAKAGGGQKTLAIPVHDSKSGALNVVVETPRGSRNKFKYDPESGLFRLSAVLPEGASFPHAFGFVPSTLGDDGDPLDVLVLMDEAVYPGCLVPSRLIGIVRARQVEADGTKVRNDRLLAASVDSHDHVGVKQPDDLTESFIKELEDFFVFYNKGRGKQFIPGAWKGPRAAGKALGDGEARYKRKRRRR